MITLGRLGGEAYLLAQKTFQKGIQQGTEYFNIHIYSMDSLLVTGWENRHLCHRKDLDLWAGLLLFHTVLIPAAVNREDLGLCKILKHDLYHWTKSAYEAVSIIKEQLILQEINPSLKKKSPKK